MPENAERVLGERTETMATKVASAASHAAAEAAREEARHRERDGGLVDHLEDA
ncbi:hypothetical protein [Methylibium sp.]|uniref:hypothetical protein n=1 Tax=Methylibium sp. TaxID=2067992 RepID=UPI0018212409|nr:hypothetical protein [Methylibium sp.]MBA3588591.1 hypothetical protein [Methylibium sp.]